MSQNSEFIKNRSFEIAWAVFRCASLVKHEALKKELEDNAINLVSTFGDFEINANNIESQKKLSGINKLYSIVRLAEAIGEIKIVNARVLYRELKNLSEAVKNSINLFKEDLNKKSNEDILIEDIFSSSSQSPIFENFGETSEKADEDSREESESVIGKSATNSAKNNNSSAKATINNMMVGQGAVQLIRQNSATINNSEVEKIVRQEPLEVRQESPYAEFAIAINQRIGTKFRKANNNSDDDSIQDSWQNLIYRKIREIGKTSTKEIAAFFPEISDRTVRFYLQKLNDSGLIEKIGTTGPGSYYLIKK